AARAHDGVDGRAGRGGAGDRRVRRTDLGAGRTGSAEPLVAGRRLHPGGAGPVIARLVSISGLLVVWLALMESITMGSVLGGLAIGFGLFVLFPDRDGGTSVSTIRPLRVVALAVHFTVQF